MLLIENPHMKQSADSLAFSFCPLPHFCFQSPWGGTSLQWYEILGCLNFRVLCVEGTISKEPRAMWSYMNLCHWANDKNNKESGPNFSRFLQNVFLKERRIQRQLHAFIHKTWIWECCCVRWIFSPPAFSAFFDFRLLLWFFCFVCPVLIINTYTIYCAV